MENRGKLGKTRENRGEPGKTGENWKKLEKTWENWKNKIEKTRRKLGKNVKTSCTKEPKK